jgi:predicted negative regulator of RcsB-dependent stress response
LFLFPSPEVAMSAQPIASRPRGPQRIDSDDVVIARALEFTQWAKRNIRMIVIGAVAATLLVGGLLYYRMHQADRMERAAAEYLQIEQSVALGNPAMAIPDLERFVQRFDGTPYADEARVQLGQIHLQQGEPARAVEALQPVSGRIGRSPVGAQGALLLASAEEAAGNREAAVQTYLRVADRAEFPFRRQEALYSAAILREEMGDHAGAAELYRRLATQAEAGSMQRSIYEMRLAEVEARAQPQ